VGSVHFILQEYPSARWDTNIFSRPRSANEKICLTYPNSQQVKAPPTVPSPNSFLEYCSVHLRIDAKRELPGHETPPDMDLSAYVVSNLPNSRIPSFDNPPN